MSRVMTLIISKGIKYTGERVSHWWNCRQFIPSDKQEGKVDKQEGRVYG